MKMLFFEEKETEKEYFETHELPDFEITKFETPLNKDTELTEEQYQQTVILNVFINSELTEEVISKFKNLMIIVTRSTDYNHIDIDFCKKKHIAVINAETPAVIIPPHIACNTADSVNKIMDITFMAAKDYFKGKKTNLVF